MAANKNEYKFLSTNSEIARLNAMIQLIHVENLYLMDRLGCYQKDIKLFEDKMDRFLRWDPENGKEDSL